MQRMIFALVISLAIVLAAAPRVIPWLRKLPSTIKGLFVSLLSPGYLACVVLFVLRVAGIV